MSAATKSVDDTTTAELSQLYIACGIDLTSAPAIMTSEQLAPAVGVSAGALANDRYRKVGIPFIKIGRRVRYLRADVARYLLANRTEHTNG